MVNSEQLSNLNFFTTVCYVILLVPGKIVYIFYCPSLILFTLWLNLSAARARHGTGTARARHGTEVIIQKISAQAFAWLGLALARAQAEVCQLCGKVRSKRYNKMFKRKHHFVQIALYKKIFNDLFWGKVGFKAKPSLLKLVS